MSSSKPHPTTASELRQAQEQAQRLASEQAKMRSDLELLRGRVESTDGASIRTATHNTLVSLVDLYGRMLAAGEQRERILGEEIHRLTQENAQLRLASSKR